MTVRYNLLILSLLLSSRCLLGQTPNSNAPIIIHAGLPLFDDASRNQVVIVVNDFNRGESCPPIYTNTLSNTNLFSPEEQKWLAEIYAKYRNVATNSGPMGSVRLTTLFKTNADYLVSRFRDTSSVTVDEVFFAPPRYDYIQLKSRDKSDIGNDIIKSDAGGAVRAPELELCQIKHGIPDGLCVSWNGNHCSSLRRYANGKTVGKWFKWYEDGKLAVEVEFKEPFDFEKHALHLPGL